MAYSPGRLIVVPPDKGSFPLDHDGVCRDLMVKYMHCLGNNNRQTTKCRMEMRDYLDCRMKNNLMAKESFKTLGLPEFVDSKE